MIRRQQNVQTNEHNNGKDGYFRLDYDNKMGYKHILSIP